MISAENVLQVFLFDENKPASSHKAVVAAMLSTAEVLRNHTTELGRIENNNTFVSYWLCNNVKVRLNRGPAYRTGSNTAQTATAKSNMSARQQGMVGFTSEAHHAFGRHLLLAERRNARIE